MSRHVTVYRSKRIADMYLYVDTEEDLSRVPDELLKRFGTRIEALRFELTRERTLARADPLIVLEKLDSDGYFLQLPPDPTGFGTSAVDKG